MRSTGGTAASFVKGNLLLTLPIPEPGGPGVPGDADDDGDVDSDDVAAFQACMGGPTVAPASGCEDFDLDADGDVDLADYVVMQPHLSGAGVLPGEPHLVYDYRNRMVEYTDAATGKRHTYAYDPLNRRIRKTVDAGPPDDPNPNAVTTLYFYDGWRVYEERDAADNVVASYVYGNGIDEVLTVRRVVAPGTPGHPGGGGLAEVDYWFHADDLGSIVAVTDSAGEVLERYEYNDYGQPRIFDKSGTPRPASAIGNPILFTGRWFDPETGLYEYRHRYLDPRTGRFTTRDPIGTWGDVLNFGNAFVYAASNPWTLFDPFGLEPPVPIDIQRQAEMQLGRPTCTDCHNPHVLGAPFYGKSQDPLSPLQQQVLRRRVERWGYHLYAVQGESEAQREGFPARLAEAALFTALAAPARAAREAAAVAKVKPKPCAPGPKEPYNRRAHYGSTPKKSDRKAMSTGKNEVVDHDPPLVKRYYEGDPAKGEPPGHTMTPEQRRASANDRARMNNQPRSESDRQGGQMSAYSREMKEKHGL